MLLSSASPHGISDTIVLYQLVLNHEYEAVLGPAAETYGDVIYLTVGCVSNVQIMTTCLLLHHPLIQC